MVETIDLSDFLDMYDDYELEEVVVVGLYIYGRTTVQRRNIGKPAKVYRALV